MRRTASILLLLTAWLGFATLPSLAQSPNLEQRYPDVVSAKVTPRGGNRFDFDSDLRKTAPAALQLLAVLFALSSSLRLAGSILRKSYLM